MSDTKTSAETAATTLDGTELVPGVQSAADVKITVAQILAASAVVTAVATTSPNDAVPTLSLKPKTGTNVDLALIPVGSGALVASVANNVASGGWKRGQYAVDWQLGRDTGSQVASGRYAVVGGGTGNTAAENCSLVPGGASNAANNEYSSALGGSSNIGAASFAVTVGGFGNYANGTYAVASGNLSHSRGTLGVKSHSAGGYSGSTPGQAQSREIQLRAVTLDATETVLSAELSPYYGGGTIVLPALVPCAFAFRAMLLGLEESTSACAAWEIKGLVFQTATSGSIAFSGSTPTPVAVGGTAPSGWSCRVAVDTGTGGLDFFVTGTESTHICWLVVIDSTEITYAT